MIPWWIRRLFCQHDNWFITEDPDWAACVRCHKTKRIH